MKEAIKKGIGIGIGFIGVIVITGITYAAYNQLSDVSDTDMLTSSIWNQMIDNQDDFDSRVSSLESEESPYGPTFSVSAYTSVTTPAATRKIIPFNTEQVDTDNSFNTSTYRFQPAKAGYYRINLNLTIGMTGTSGFTIYGGIFKNNVQYRTSYELISYTSSFTETLNVSDVIYLNGTTDYIDGRFQSNSGIAANNTSTFMSGEFIRP